MAKKAKGQARKRKAATTDLTAKDARRVKGGGGEVVARKAGKEQHDYLIVKMTDVLVTGVSHTGNADGA
jgi:type VI protein secretion system component Hcp